MHVLVATMLVKRRYSERIYWGRVHSAHKRWLSAKAVASRLRTKWSRTGGGETRKRRWVAYFRAAENTAEAQHTLYMATAANLVGSAGTKECMYWLYLQYEMFRVMSASTEKARVLASILNGVRRFPEVLEGRDDILPRLEAGAKGLLLNPELAAALRK
jgi:hypothetical protein